MCVFACCFKKRLRYRKQRVEQQIIQIIKISQIYFLVRLRFNLKKKKFCQKEDISGKQLGGRRGIDLISKENEKMDMNHGSR